MIHCRTMRAIKAGGAWKIIDLSLAADAPDYWVDGSSPTLSVQKSGTKTILPDG